MSGRWRGLRHQHRSFWLILLFGGLGFMFVEWGNSALPTNNAPTAIIGASPNPVPLRFSNTGSTAIEWQTPDGTVAQVFVVRDDNPESLFAEGSSGKQVADWIQTGSVYEFRLYAKGPPRLLLASVQVSGRGFRSLELFIASLFFVMLIVVSAGLLVRRRFGESARTRGAKQVVSYNHDKLRTWLLEIGFIFLVTICLWIKLVYASRLMANKAVEGLSDQVVGSASLAIVMLLIWSVLLWPRVWRLVPLFLFDVLISVVLLADELYFRRYIDILSIEDLASASVLLEPFARSVILQLPRPIDFLYVFDLAVLLSLTPFYVRAARRQAAMSFRLRGKVAICILVIGALAAVPAVRLLWGGRGFVVGNESYRGKIARTMGILPYHIYEVIARLSGPPEPGPDLAHIRQLLAVRRETASKSSLFGIAKRKNLILIQAESLQGFPIGLTIDGQAVAPNLAAFAAESLQFTNFFDQTHHGFTSDGEFTALSSLHPLPEGSASVTFRTNHYRSLPAILAAREYVTLSACAADSRVWSMAMMHPNHGFELSLFEDRFEDPGHQQHISDGVFFSQMLRGLTVQPQPFMAFLITSTNHGPPFEVPERYRTLRLPPRLDGSLLGDYLQSVHYFDQAFGEFVQGLRKTGLLDEAVVALYGDHQPYLNRAEEITGLAGYPARSKFHQWVVEKRLPLLIRLPRGERAGLLDTPTGHLDIAPTILSLLGVDDGDRVMLGRDATGNAPPFVVFRNGGFADGAHYYTLPHALSGKPICYQAHTGYEIDCQELEAGYRRAREVLAVSDAVLRRDLIPVLVRAPIPMTVADLPPPRPFSPEFNLHHVAISAFDVRAPVPSGATFSVGNGGGVVRVLFAPIIDKEVPKTQINGVIFEVWSGESMLYQRRVLPDDLEAAAVDVLPVPGRDRTEISLVTKAVVGGVAGPYRATWQRVRFLTGSTARANPLKRPNSGKRELNEGIK